MQVWREEFRFEQEGVVPFLEWTVIHIVGTELSSKLNQPGLFDGLKRKVGVNTEHQELLLAATLEDIVQVLQARFRRQIEPLPGVENPQVAVGVSASQTSRLVKHVGLDRMVHLIPAVWRFLADTSPRAPLGAACRVNEGLVRDAPASASPVSGLGP